MYVYLQPTLPCYGCGSSCKVLTEASGSFNDGSGVESSYANQANCHWIIAPLNASTVTVSFTDFSVLGPDSLVISQCHSISCGSKTEVITLFGSLYSNQQFTTSTGYMHLQFTSNSAGNDRGFNLVWTSSTSLPEVSDVLLSYCACKCKTCLIFFMQVYMDCTDLVLSECKTTRCAQANYPCRGCESCGLRTAATGTISDGSGAANYDSTYNCKWLIAPGGALGVTLTFTEFRTTNNNDAVDIYRCIDIHCLTPVLVSSVSGIIGTPRTVSSPTGFMLVTFRP
jgi:hypothetical protein